MYSHSKKNKQIKLMHLSYALGKFTQIKKQNKNNKLF